MPTYPAQGTRPWDSLLQTYIDAAGGGGSSATLPSSNGTNDTTAINAVLATGAKVVRGKAGESYKINAPLVVLSGQTLDMTGCTVTLNASSDCNMLRNTNSAGPGRDSNIAIVGGTWDRGANGGTGNVSHSLFLRKIDGLRVEQVKYASTGGKYGIAVGDVTDYKIDKISSTACASDLVHITGPALDGEVSNIRSTSGGDDAVGVTTTDFTAYDDVHGTVDNLNIRNVSGSNTTRLVLLAGSANGTADGFLVQNVTVERVRQFGSGEGVYIAAQVAGSAMTHDGITIRGVRGGRVYLRAPRMGQVVVEDALALTGAPAVHLTPEASPQNANIIDRLILRNCRATASSSQVFSASNSISVIGQMDVYDSSSSGSRFADWLCGAVTSVRFHNCEVASTTLEPFIINASGCTVSNLVFNGLRGTLPTTIHYLKCNAGTLTTVTFNDPQLTAADTNSGSLVSVTATGFSLGKVNVRGGRLDALKNILDHQSTGTGVTSELNVTDTKFNGCNRIFQASNVTLEFKYTDVTYTSGVNEPARIYGGGALNVRGQGWSGRTASCVIRAAAEVVHVIAQDFPADVSVLTGANGDTFTNTNTSANPFVAGPMVRDATNAFWVHEQGYALAGTATLAAGTVTVSNSNVTANAVIRVVIQTPGGTVGAPFVSTITAATSFVIKSTSASDTSVVRWEIVRY